MTRRYRSMAVLAVLLLGGCVADGGQQMPRTAGLDGCTIGAGVGALAGGLSAAFLDRGATSAMRRFGVPAVGAAAGGWLGHQIGCALSPRDQQRASDAVVGTVATGRNQTWSSPDTGASGQTRVVDSSGNCRTVEQVVTLADGTQRSEQVRACRGANGWEVAG